MVFTAWGFARVQVVGSVGRGGGVNTECHLSFCCFLIGVNST